MENNLATSLQLTNDLKRAVTQCIAALLLNLAPTKAIFCKQSIGNQFLNIWVFPMSLI